MKIIKQYIFLTAVCLFMVISANAQSLKVAVAANLQDVIKVIGQDFKQKTGIDIEPIVGSSGNLTAQIKNGAPFDLFLSADMSFPEMLFKEGFSLKAPVVYAYGTLIICSSQNIGFENWERVLLSDRVKKIAIANPAIAPYGKAAEESLKVKGILGDIKSKIVTGESIAQVNTYITTGVVDVGFTTLSLTNNVNIKAKRIDPKTYTPLHIVKDKEGKTSIQHGKYIIENNTKREPLLYWKEIDRKSYAPIKQGMIIIKQTKENANALKFYEYMLSPSAKAILKEYGYGV